MAKTKKGGESSSSFRIKSKKKNPGVSAKSKTSKSKKSKNYKKAYVGQGR